MGIIPRWEGVSLHLSTRSCSFHENLDSPPYKVPHVAALIGSMGSIGRVCSNFYKAR
jgi:hypothetical protein